MLNTILCQLKGVIESGIEGASIGYQIKKRRWQLYQAPISMKDFSSLKIKAVRYGWEESEVVTMIGEE